MLNIISLGAGVQSSTVALMAAAGELAPMPDGAIFADTQAEPKRVYEWLDYLEKLLPFPVWRVGRGDLRKATVEVRRSSRSNNVYVRSLIPAFIKNPDGSKGLLGRKCTRDFKIDPIVWKLRDLTGIRRSRSDMKPVVRQWIGISLDEAHRMKPSAHPWIEHTWPLIDVGMTRQNCLDWMKRKGYPEPPRSACTFCPFHGDHEWARIKRETPDEFEKVAQFERQLQQTIKEHDTRMRGVPYLHAKLIPIDQVKFENGPSHVQLDWFGNECEGLCGV